MIYMGGLLLCRIQPANCIPCVWSDGKLACSRGLSQLALATLLFSALVSGMLGKASLECLVRYRYSDKCTNLDGA